MIYYRKTLLSGGPKLTAVQAPALQLIYWVLVLRP